MLSKRGCVLFYNESSTNEESVLMYVSLRLGPG